MAPEARVTPNQMVRSDPETWGGMHAARVFARSALRTGAVLAAVLAACSSGEQTESRATVAYDTVGTIPRVTSQGPPAPWSLSLLHRIGSVTDTITGFGRVRSVVMDSASNVFVADVLTSRIVVIDSAGDYVRTIGRKGAGPGEFEQPYALGWLGDTLFVLDWRNARVGKFSKLGAWQGLLRWQPVTGPQVLLTNGSAADLYVPFIWAARGNTLAYLHLTPGGVADTIRWPEWPGDAARGPICRIAGGIRFFDIPFGPHMVLAGGPGGTLFTGWSASYQIARITAQVDTIQLIRRVTIPVPIADAEWEVGTEDYRTFDKKAPGVSCERDQTRPAAKPAFRWFGSDMDGRLWVEAYAPEGFAFDVFDSGGALLASMPAPARDADVSPAIGRGRLAIVTRDSLDVQYVEVYAIEEGRTH